MKKQIFAILTLLPLAAACGTQETPRSGNTLSNQFDQVLDRADTLTFGVNNDIWTTTDARISWKSGPDAFPFPVEGSARKIVRFPGSPAEDPAILALGRSGMVSILADAADPLSGWVALIGNCGRDLAAGPAGIWCITRQGRISTRKGYLWGWEIQLNAPKDGAMLAVGDQVWLLDRSGRLFQKPGPSTGWVPVSVPPGTVKIFAEKSTLWTLDVFGTVSQLSGEGYKVMPELTGISDLAVDVNGKLAVRRDGVWINSAE